MKWGRSQASQPPSMPGVTPPLPWVLYDRVKLAALTSPRVPSKLKLKAGVARDSFKVG